jgi:deazaflavin-dependent oxidoreductase (nitroreductase family)
MISDEAARAAVCLLETIGRVSGRPRIVEIWFAADPGRRRIYMLSGGRDRAGWVRNLRVQPNVRIRLADEWLTGGAGSSSRATRTGSPGACWPRSTRVGTRAGR